MSDPFKSTRVGDSRASQLMYDHGVGAIVELPYFSAIVMGLGDWDRGEILSEPRLLQAVRQSLPSVRELRLPKTAPDLPSSEYRRAEGVPVRTFPGWLTCPDCLVLGHVESGLFSLRTNAFNPAKNLYQHSHCSSKRKSPPTARPVRFLAACPDGHLDEFPWHWYLHGDRHCPGPMTLFDLGLPGDFGSLVLKCGSCDRKRSLTEAFGEKGTQSMPQCRGFDAHLARFAAKGCHHQMTTVTVGASNLWFPIKRSVLALPDALDQDPLDLTIARFKEENPKAFQRQLDSSDSERLRNFLEDDGHPELAQLLEDGSYDLEEIWTRIKSYTPPSRTAPAPGEDLRRPEWQLLAGLARDQQGLDFEANLERPPAAYRRWIDSVVRVDRLREVSALIGFTRLEAPDKFDPESEAQPMRRVPLSHLDPSWVPAAETRGEGIFIRFDEQVLRQWSQRPEVRLRDQAFHAAHSAWREVLGYPDPHDRYPGIRFVLLHSFAHLLMRRMALECGYGLASLREKIYCALPGDEGGSMAGVLIFTAQSDSEGSLGGLVALGRQERLASFIDQALEQGRICASDPFCAEHGPSVTGQPACTAPAATPACSCPRAPASAATATWTARP